ncbi:MAG: hypothetical protein PF487_03420 [Bacteroidales bacterium]|nr:hypothetical protein [Bacteroidales bacterium]
MGIVNLGVPHSMNVLLVQNKNYENNIKDIEANAILLISIIAVVISLVCLTYYVYDLKFFEKYEINKYILFIGILAIIGHFNTLFLVIYRFRNSLFEIAFQQSFTPILVFISLFFAKGQNLLFVVIFANIAGNLVSLFVFIVRKKIQVGGKMSISGSISLLNKGLYLFIYLTAFYLIIISTRSIVSAKYSVESFGYFTFSFTLANSILLFLQAFSFIISAKVLDKLKSKNSEEVLSNINKINVNYVTLTYVILFLAIVAFPFLLNLFPKYKVVLPTLNMISLSIMLYANSFAQTSFLMAQNKEKTLATISLIAILINVTFALLLANIFQVKIEFVVLSTMLSYFVFGFLCSYYTHKFLNGNVDLKKVLNHFLPLRLFIPYATAIIVVVIENQYFMTIPLILLIILNHKEIGAIIKSVRLVINRSNIVDLQ